MWLTLDTLLVFFCCLYLYVSKDSKILVFGIDRGIQLSSMSLELLISTNISYNLSMSQSFSFTSLLLMFSETHLSLRINTMVFLYVKSVHLLWWILHMIAFWQPPWKFSSFSKETCCCMVHGGGWWLNLLVIIEFQMPIQNWCMSATTSYILLWSCLLFLIRTFHVIHFQISFICF